MARKTRPTAWGNPVKVPDQNTIEALNSIQHSERRDFDQILDWLRASYQDAMEACRDARDDVDLRRAQGQAAELGDILKQIQEAPENMRKLRKQT